MSTAYYWYDTKNYTGRYGIGLKSIFVPDWSPFHTQKMSIYPDVTLEITNKLAKVSKQQENQRAEKTKNWKKNKLMISN